MSVWCSTLHIEAEGCDDGPRLGAPIAYRESHILPHATDPRAGSLALALIPRFITYDGYDDGPEDGTCWPYLRMSLRTDVPGEDTIVLDHRQVDALITELTAWRARVVEEP